MGDARADVVSTSHFHERRKARGTVATEILTLDTGRGSRFIPNPNPAYNTLRSVPVIFQGGYTGGFGSTSADLMTPDAESEQVFVDSSST